MDLLGLRYFQAVARLEHLSRAADELAIAQPSLSRAIARLETELGVPLFDRTGRNLRLNRFGSRFLRRVDRVLGELDDARRELADAAGLEHGSIEVAAETLLTLTGLLAAFRAEHPGVDIRLFQSPADAMAGRLRAGEVDLCFPSQDVGGPGLRSVELFREEVLLAVPPDHRLAGRDRVSLTEIADEPFVTTRTGYWQRALTDRLFAAEGRTPNLVCESDEPAATQLLISAGLGIGLVPGISRVTLPYVPVAWLHVDTPECERSLNVVWREDAYLSTAATRLRDFARKYFREWDPATVIRPQRTDEVS